MVDGVKIYELKKFFDERGFFCEILRQDWKDILGEEWIAQANLSYSYPGIIRAWHRHLRGQVDYFMVLKGTMKICVYDEETGELDEILSTANDPQVIRIPGKYWHGFKAVSNTSAWLLYFTTKLYDYEKPDEERKPWNDPTIIPKSINGKTDDPRIGKPWDWNYPPHK